MNNRVKFIDIGIMEKEPVAAGSFFTNRILLRSFAGRKTQIGHPERNALQVSIVLAFSIQAERKKLCFFVHLDNLLAVIVAAMLADPVCQFLCVALGAFYDSGDAELPVSPALITPCFRCFSLRYCHFLHLLFIIEQLCEFFKGGEVGILHRS